MHTEVCELLHPAIPAQFQRERNNESPQMGGTQVPTYSLTAGANTVRSLVGQRSKWGGTGVEGKIQGKLKIWNCSVFQNSQRTNSVCSTLNYPADTFSFALFLIGFTVQNAEVCFTFFSEVPNSNFESSGVFGSRSVFSRIPTEHWNPSFANLFL